MEPLKEVEERSSAERYITRASRNGGLFEIDIEEWNDRWLAT
jgi:hypothetical protein